MWTKILNARLDPRVLSYFGLDYWYTGDGLGVGPLLHHTRVFKRVQVNVANEVSQWVLHKALGNIRLGEGSIDSVERDNSSYSAAKNLDLGFTEQRGNPERDFIIWSMLKLEIEFTSD